MTIKAAGLTDHPVVEYTWTDTSASWTLVSAGQLKSQDAKYTLTPDGDKTKVKLEINVDPSVPLPGFIIKRADEGRDGDRDRWTPQTSTEGQEGWLTPGR